jgi:signal transduction histidine kinase
VEANSLARQIRDLALATPSGLEVVTELGENLPPISIDRQQMLQVCWNMVNNAIEAMDGQGTLTIATRLVPEQNAVAIDLSDTGPGIRPQDLKRIFDPFYSTKPNGTGLGLSICHRIVEEHGGTIEVRTEPGKGSSFSVILPVTE